MADALLDTSAILAFIFAERYDVEPDIILANAAISSVNYAEAYSVLRARNVPDEAVRATLDDFGLQILPFEQREAAIAGALIPEARRYGIGLGDCACIATGIAHGTKIWTADHDWLKLGVGADINLIRKRAGGS